MKKESLQKHDSDRSGFTHLKSDLVRQRGLLVAKDEVDDLRKIKKANPRWGSPRENSTTTTAVTERTTFAIAAAGISALQQSYPYREDGSHTGYLMLVAGDGGPIDITGNPQIVDGSNGDFLTLKGTDDTNTLLLEDGNGLSLQGSFTLGKDDSITLVYTAEDDIWRETSRVKGGM